MKIPGRGMVMASLRTAYWRQEEFRADPAVRLDAEQVPMRLAITFTRVDEELPRNRFGGFGDWTYFGGLPAHGPDGPLPWPRRRSGEPLCHVLQVDLFDIAEDQGEEEVEDTGLPPTGLLQFFHDPYTYGNEEDEDDAWLVRWVPRGEDDDGEDEGGDWRLTRPPADLDDDRRRPPIALAAEVAPMIPNNLDFGLNLSKKQLKRYIPLYEWFQEYPYRQNVGRRPEDENPLTPWDKGYEPLDEPSRLCGFSAVPFKNDYDVLLRRFLPLDPAQPDDERVLLADLHIRQLGETEWSHGGRHIEFWMRASDLAARRFDRTWSLIRTDH